MSEYETEEYEEYDDNGFGWFGWLSAAGFVILGLLYVLDATGTAEWPLSPELTGALAILAGIGALLLYYGNDPTRRGRRRVT